MFENTHKIRTCAKNALKSCRNLYLYTTITTVRYQVAKQRLRIITITALTQR